MSDTPTPGPVEGTRTPIHVVALSGGKDSTALALRLRELHPDVPFRFVCTPTGDELPEMFAHWRKLGELLSSRIEPIMGDVGLVGLIDRERCLPNHAKRFCTRQLKIVPYRRWLASVAPAVSYVGLRADEPGREGGDYDNIPGVESRYPLREWGWGVDEVWDYLDSRGVSIPARTDCARCYAQRLAEWFRLWRDHPGLYADAEAQEARHGHTFRSPSRDTWPAALADLRARFEAGDVPKERKRDAARLAMCRACSL